MEAVNDTEIQETVPAVDVQNEFDKSKLENVDDTEIEENVVEKDTERIEDILEQFISLYGNNSNENLEVVAETTVIAENENKTFEQSGFEIAVVLCLAILIGLKVLDMLTERWYT